MDRRVERTRRNIYLAFFELLKKKAMDEITITELANAADIDRRTFYKHYSTVTDVYLEFKQQMQDELLGFLEDCETDGADGSPFDFVRFFAHLEKMMEGQRPFFEKLSSDKASMFLRYDCKDSLEGALLDFYKGRFPGSDEELGIYAATLAYAVTGFGSDYLTKYFRTTSFADMSALLAPLLQKLWIPRT